MSKIDINGVKTGLLHSQKDTGGNSIECPVGMIQDCYFQFRDVGLDLSDIFKWQVHGCQFYNEGNGVNVCGDCVGATVYDIHLRNASIVDISGCRFNVSAAPNRYHIFVDADAGTNSSAKHVLIAHNMFGEDIAGIDGISAIVVSPSALNVVIGVNAYIGQYTGSIVDDRTSTGQAMAPLGFPSTGALTPPATFPSSYAANLSPTLGTAKAAWPELYNQLHTLIPASVPKSGPISGWLLVSDGTTLWAMQGNNKKQLAP